ncbi:helix-turn-helix domain-containing protein [Bartonella sp. W8122]|uniref:helix-turn-helix domain-containing protein n=1 Tax=Bartonella sp. W8122 TaxID=2750930 RepID=UPI0018DBE0CB|nr:helix-turn-helix domain-containing protein [Bartonella sp. W8122]MBI0002322.1 helix-turn-helix domain-containing protein [Bartonella sp. W8122]
MNNDVIIARQREKIGELEEQVRQLKKLLVPPFVTPAEWHLTRKQQALFCMFLKRDLVTRDMLDAADITGASITPNYGNVILYQLRKKLKKFGFELKNEYGLGWRLVDRKSWQKRLTDAEAAE